MTRHTSANTARRLVAGADLRRAVVLSVILGRCRALEPTDASQPL